MNVRPIVRPMVRAMARTLVRSSFDPLSLFANGEEGAWYDPSDLTTLFQDSAGTIPVTADGDPVGLMLDKSGNGNHASQDTTGSKPIYRTDGTLHWLEFDGFDDSMRTNTAVDFSASTAVFMSAAVEKTSDAVSGLILANTLGFSPVSGDGQFVLRYPRSSTEPGVVFANRAGGAYNIAYDGTGAPLSPYSDVVSGTLLLGTLTARAGGVEKSEAAGPDVALRNDLLRLGGHEDASFAGKFYGGLLRGGVFELVDVQNAEAYLATKSGVTL